MQLDIGYRTVAGAGRTRNEDAIGVLAPEASDAVASRGVLLAVADGTGRHDAGELVSRTAVDAILRIYESPGFVNVEQALRRAIETANEIVGYERRRYANPVGIGTALAVAVIRGEELFTANVGDVRVYHLDGQTLSQLTRDHPWDAASRQAIALGVQAEVEVHLTSGARLQAGDAVLVCSDGLWETVPPRRLAALLVAGTAQQAADALVAAAQEQGSSGDISAVVGRCLKDP